MEFVVYLDESSRKRHYHESEKGQISYFAVQLEVKINSEWKQVIRYDCAHNFAHVDKYDAYGKQTKEDLHMDFASALTYGDLDINRNWMTYKMDYLKKLK